jgi:hypothetical protein
MKQVILTAILVWFAIVSLSAIDAQMKDLGAYVDTLRVHAKNGKANAQYELGVLYFEGIVLTQNFDEAFKLFKAASDKKHIDAQVMLALCYKNGSGTTKNLKEAVKLFTDAANKKNTKAQYNLGVLYYNGEGVAANNKEAVKWFKLASEAGHYEAQSNLGLCYYEGTGVAVDYSESYYWLALAAKLCPPVYEEEYIAISDKSKVELTEAQISAVDKRIEEWLSKHNKSEK